MKTRKPRTLTLCLATFATVFATSCGSILPRAGNRVVFVPESSGMVRLAEDVRGHVYVLRNGEWERTAEPVTLPAGWYAGSLEEESGE